MLVNSNFTKICYSSTESSYSRHSRKRIFYDRIISNEPELKDDVMTVAEQSEAKGEARVKQEMAIKMLNKGFSVQQVIDISDLPKIKVQELKNSIKH